MGLHATYDLSGKHLAYGADWVETQVQELFETPLAISESEKFFNLTQVQGSQEIELPEKPAEGADDKEASHV